MLDPVCKNFHFIKKHSFYRINTHSIKCQILAPRLQRDAALYRISPFTKWRVLRHVILSNHLLLVVAVNLKAPVMNSFCKMNVSFYKMNDTICKTVIVWKMEAASRQNRRGTLWSSAAVARISAATLFSRLIGDVQARLSRFAVARRVDTISIVGIQLTKY